MNTITHKHLVSLLRHLETREEFILLDTSKPTLADHTTFLFLDPLEWISCPPDGDPQAFLREAQQLHDQGYYLSGWFGYEFGYLLEPRLKSLLPNFSGPAALLGVFDRVHSFDHQSGQFSHDFPEPQVANDLCSSYQIDNLHPNTSKQEYLAAVERVKNYILAGDTYQVNYTFKLDFSFTGSPAALYMELRKNQSVSYGAWIRARGEDIMSFSPELFFRAQQGVVTVKPMKGTMKRGRTVREDADQRAKLASDIKNKSENVMIVDLLRNDLGRLIHDTGGGEVRPVSLFDVETYETILQMTSTIEGVSRNQREPSLQETLVALFPCGSVTGAPKIRTMEIIRELEKEPRGVYCGAIGYWGAESCVFNVPIRTLTLRDGHGSMGIGSGIVHDSDADNEWNECLLKGKFLSVPRPEFQLIETMLWSPESGYLFLDLHLERLLDSAMFFLFSINREEIERRLDGLEQQLVRENKPCRVRCLLHQDSRFELSATVLESFNSPVLFPSDAADPLPVTVSSRRTDNADPFLYHKTTNRSLYNEERAAALEKGYYEIFFVNAAGELTEGAISNIFIKQGDNLWTPSLSCGLLAGTLRRFLLEKGVAKEKILRPDDLQHADAVYMGNSLRGLVRVVLSS